MKSTLKFFAGAAAALLAVAGSAYANPRAAEASGADYLAAAEDLDGFHIGSYYRYQARELSHGANNLSQDTIAFVLGYDVFKWFSIYGVVGTADAELERYDYGDRDYNMVYGVGAWLNILDHDLLSNLTCESKVRLTATAQCTFESPEINGEEYDATDLYGALTLGIVNELVGNKNIWPDAIGLFVGPVWSTLDSDDIDTTGDEMGFAFGLDLYVTRYVGLSFSYETYGHEDDAVNFSLNCRF